MIKQEMEGGSSIRIQALEDNYKIFQENLKVYKRQMARNRLKKCIKMLVTAAQTYPLLPQIIISLENLKIILQKNRKE